MADAGIVNIEEEKTKKKREHIFSIILYAYESKNTELRSLSLLSLLSSISLSRSFATSD